MVHEGAATRGSSASGQRAASLALSWLVIGLLAGCPRQGSEEDPLPGLLETADQAWQQRGQRGFQPVEDALIRASEVAPGDPEIQWRYSRLAIGRGLAAADRFERVRHFSRAREYAVRCLQVSPGFEVVRTAQGWPAALDEVPPARGACGVWAGLGWSRWMVDYGGASAAVDLDALDALVAWQAERTEGARSFGVEVDPGGLYAWTEGLVSATRPVEAGRDLQLARTRLGAAVQARPDDLARRADLVLLAAAPLEDTELLQEQVRALREATPDTPEDRRAVQRVLDAVATDVTPETDTGPEGVR